MRNLGILLKNYIKTFFGNFNSKRNKRAYLSGGIIVLLFGILFTSLFTSMAYTTVNEIKKDPEANVEMALYALTAIDLLFALMLLVMKGSTTRKALDAELLLSLPIKKSIIVASKILKDLIFDFVPLLFVMMPGFIVYGIFSGVPGAWVVIPLGFVVVVFISLLINALAVFIRTLVFKLTYRLKYADVIQTIISVFLAICFVIFYYYFMSKIQSADESSMNMLMNFYPVSMLVEIVTFKSILKLIILVVISIGLFMLSCLYLTLSFNKSYQKYQNKDTNLVFVKNSVTKDLFHREVSRYFRSTMYVLNTIIGALFIVLFAFLITIFGKERIISTINLYASSVAGLFSDHIDNIIVLLAGIVTSTCITTSCSISLEGKQLWILKANPIDTKSIFHSKILLNMVIGIIPIILSSIILAIQLGFMYLPFLLVIEVLFLAWSAMIGLYVNLKYPKLDWKDESEPIKQSIAVLVAMILAILPGVIIFGLYMSLMLGLNGYLALGIVCGIMLIVDILIYKLLMTKGKKRFEELY